MSLAEIAKMAGNTVDSEVILITKNCRRVGLSFQACSRSINVCTGIRITAPCAWRAEFDLYQTCLSL